MTAALQRKSPKRKRQRWRTPCSAIIRPVIGRMGGAVTAAGSYFIPLQETTQITIDCAQIPVVELDDGTTVFLDYGDRLSENLKGLIRQSGKNYAFLTAEAFRDGLGGLQGIIGHSRNYRMIRADKPLELTVKPEIFVFPDWIISGKETADGATYRQGLFLLDRGERPLPADARAFIEKNGFAVTEIAGDRVVSSLESPPALQPAITDLQGLKGIAFAEKLLSLLGETPIRNAEVVVFDQDRHGFNISVTGELLIRKGEKQFILLTKRLPEQFLQHPQGGGYGGDPDRGEGSGQASHRRHASGTGDPRLLRPFLLPDSRRGHTSAAYGLFFRPSDDERGGTGLSDRFRHSSPHVCLFSPARRGGRIVRY